MPQTAATHSVQFTNADNNVDFDVHAFNSQTGISNTFAFSDVFYQKGFEDSQSDAKAEIEHVIDEFQNMFKLNVPYMGLNSANLDGSNIRYFITTGSWPTIPFSQAVVKTNQVNPSSANQTIGRDMLRYMVEKISGGTNMLGLFKNQKSILDELNNAANTTINENISNLLDGISNKILTDSDYVADQNSSTYYVNSASSNAGVEGEIAYNPLRILSSTILGDGDLDDDGNSDLNNNTRREVLLASLLNQINNHNAAMQTEEFHAVVSGADEATAGTDSQYRVFLTEAAFDAAYPQGTHPQTYSQKQVIDGNTFNARLSGVDFWGFRVSAVTGSGEALNNNKISLLENLVNVLYNFNFQDGDSINLIVEYTPENSPIGFLPGVGAGEANTITQISTTIPPRKYEIKVTLKLSPDTSVLQINDPSDPVLKDVVDSGSNKYFVNQFNEVVAPGDVNTGLNNIFSLIVARMIDSGNAETFSGKLKDFSASDYSNENDVVTDLYVLDSDTNYYPLQIGYINSTVDKYFAAVYSKAGSIVVLHAVHSDGTNPDFPVFSPGGGDYQVTQGLAGRQEWSMFKVLEDTPSASLGGNVIQLNGSVYQLAGHDLFILKNGAYLPHEVRTEYKTSNNRSVVLSNGKTLLMNKNGSYQVLSDDNVNYEYVDVLNNSHRNSLHTVFDNLSAVQLNINNSTVSVYVDYDGTNSPVQRNNGMVYCKKLNEVKLLHVCSTSGNTVDMDTLLREEDVVNINENVDFQIAGNPLKNVSEVVIQPIAMSNVTASMVVPASGSVDLVGTGVDAASSHILKVDTNNQLVSRNGFVKSNNINNLLSMTLIDGVTNTYSNGSSSLDVIKKHFDLQHAGTSNVFLHDSEAANSNRVNVNSGLETFNIGKYSSQLKLSLNNVDVYTVVNSGNNSTLTASVQTVVLTSVPSSILTNTINLVAVGINVDSKFNVFNDGNSYSNGGVGSLVGMDADRFDAAGKLLAVNAGSYANIYVVNTGSVDSSLFVSNSAGVYQLLSHNRITLTSESSLANINNTNTQLVTNTYEDTFTTAYVNGNEMKVDGNADANSTVYRPFNNHIYNSHKLYTYTSTNSIVIDIDPTTSVSSPVDGYDYLWVTWSNNSVERLNKVDGSGIRVNVLLEEYHDNEVDTLHGANSSLHVEIGGVARKIFVPNAAGEVYAELTSGDVYYYNTNVYNKLVDNNHESRYHAYPAVNEYSKLIGKNGIYWELRKNNNVRYDMGEPLSTELRIPGDLTKSLSTTELGTLYAYKINQNFVKSFGNGQYSNETETENLEVDSDLFYETTSGSGNWNTLANARTSMLTMVALSDGDYNTLNGKTSVATGYLHKNLNNGNFQAAVNGVNFNNVLLDGATPYNEITGKIYSNWTGINSETTPLHLGNDTDGPILVVSNHDTANLYVQDGSSYSQIIPAVPLTDLASSAIDTIAEKYRNGNRLYTHGEMNLQIEYSGSDTVVVDDNNIPVPLTDDGDGNGAWIEFYLSNSPNTPLLVGNVEAYFINTNLTQEQTDKTLYSRASIDGTSYHAFTQINGTVREHLVNNYVDDTASQIGVDLTLGKVFAKHGGLTITTTKDVSTSYAYVRYSGHADGDANALFENASFLRENSRLGSTSNDKLAATINNKAVVTLVAARGNIDGVSPNASEHFVFDTTTSSYTEMELTYQENVNHAVGTVTFQGKETGGSLVDYLDSNGNPILHDAITMKYLKSGDNFVHTEIGEQLFVNNEIDGNGPADSNNHLYKYDGANYVLVSLGGYDSALVSPNALNNMFDMFIPELNKTGKAIYDVVSGTRKHLIQVAENGDAAAYMSNISQRYVESNYVDVLTKTTGDSRLYVELEYTNAELVTIFGTDDMDGNTADGKVFLCTPQSSSDLNDDPASTLTVDLSSNFDHSTVSKVQVWVATNDQLNNTSNKYLAIKTSNANLYRVINIDDIQHTVISTVSSSPRKEFALFDLETEPSFTINISDSQGSSSSSTGKTLTFLVGSDAENAVPLVADSSL